MPVYHEGERRVQTRAGATEAADWGAENAIRAEIPDVAADFLAEQGMLLVGHRDDAGAVWASVLVGRPGFVSTPDERTVVAAAVPAPGDALGGSLAHGRRALGMLAIEPSTRRRMRFNGTGELREGRLRLRTEQVYANCPKYISTRHPEEAAAAAPPARDGVRRSDRLDARHWALIGAADAFFVATSHPASGADVSHRGGNPGFVAVDDARRLSWPDYRGNSMFMTLGNLDVDPRAGLLFPDWETGGAIQISGTAATDWSPTRAAAVPGAERMVDLVVEQVVELPGALGRRWTLDRLSRFNPTAAT